MRIRAGAILGLMILAGACAKRTTVPQSQPEVRPVEPPVSVEAPIKVELDSGMMRYQAESRTAVFAASDTSTALDSIIVTAQLRLSVKHSAGSATTMLSGSVERLSVTSGLGATKSSSQLDGVFKLDWRVIGDSIVVAATQSSAACDQIHETARDLLISIIPPLPETIARDQNWKASSSVTGCRAGLSLAVKSQSQLQVASNATPLNKRQITLRSAGAVTLNGNGTQGASSVVLRGTGSVATLYVLDLVDGLLRSTSSQSRTQIEFDMGYRTDRLVQRTTRLITRVQ